MRTVAHRRPRQEINKLLVLIILTGFFGLIIIARLFMLQVLKHDFYQAKADLAHSGYTELPARRGDILIQDYNSNDTFRLATNTTLDLLYADPAMIGDAEFIASQISPLIFDLEAAETQEQERLDLIRKSIPEDMEEEARNELLKTKSAEELQEEFKQTLLQKISNTQRQNILLANRLDQKILEEIQKKNLVGIEVKDNNVYAYPPQISNPRQLAQSLEKELEIPAAKLEKILRGDNRYVVIQRKLDPDVSKRIKEIYEENPKKMAGIGLQEEYFRYYPEGQFASQIVGYIDHNNIGQYGIERRFNTQLHGETGVFQAQMDSVGRQITVGESVIRPAVDGDNIILTIDRSIQLQVEKILERRVKQYDADSGQVIIMDPSTGKVIAMANYPSFDPNDFGGALEKEAINLTTEEIERLVPYDEEQGMYYLYLNEETGERLMIFKEFTEDGSTIYKKFINKVGAEVYHNKTVSFPYEPGSVFKTIAMAAAIDDNDVGPQSTYNDNGPVDVDFNVLTGKYDFQIKNSTNEYFGRVTMTQILEKSLNTGMAHVAKIMGPNLFYSYMQKFGFGERTDIELDSEHAGQIEYFANWTESELVTKAFGQGITVTPLQMANAYSAIANGGVLMQPYLVNRVEHDNGKVTEIHPQAIKRAISPESSELLTAMLVSAVENGVAKDAQIDGHYVAGKTGTSQTYRGNKALNGPGTTITSFAGFAPIHNPKFVVLVKFDKPKTTEWGATTAAPTFKEIGEFLFDYYSIPPDKY